MVDFCQSAGEFEALNECDQATLLVNSWSRLLLLYMAETNFQFAVSPQPVGVEEDSDTGREGSVPEDTAKLPTMHDVDRIQAFIKKCQTMNLDQQEYDCIRMATLFHSGRYLNIRENNGKRHVHHTWELHSVWSLSLFNLKNQPHCCWFLDIFFYCGHLNVPKLVQFLT